MMNQINTKNLILLDLHGSFRMFVFVFWTFVSGNFMFQTWVHFTPVFIVFLVPRIAISVFDLNVCSKHVVGV